MRPFWVKERVFGWGFLTVFLTGCTHTTEVTVKDPALVGATVTDKDGKFVDLPTGCKPCAVDTLLPPFGFFNGKQRFALRRDKSGRLQFEAPDTPGNTSGTLVTEHGIILAPPSYLGADDAARFGTDLRVRYMVTMAYGHTAYSSEYQHISPDFEIWLHTPISNVARANVQTTPIRGFGVLFILFGGALTVASLASLTIKDASTRAVGAGVLGGFALTFGASGTLLLALPETTTSLNL